MQHFEEQTLGGAAGPVALLVEGNAPEESNVGMRLEAVSLHLFIIIFVLKEQVLSQN